MWKLFNDCSHKLVGREIKESLHLSVPLIAAQLIYGGGLTIGLMGARSDYATIFQYLIEHAQHRHFNSRGQ